VSVEVGPAAGLDGVGERDFFFHTVSVAHLAPKVKGFSQFVTWPGAVVPTYYLDLGTLSACAGWCGSSRPPRADLRSPRR
jgi:hypothetical protein